MKSKNQNHTEPDTKPLQDDETQNRCPVYAGKKDKTGSDNQKPYRICYDDGTSTGNIIPSEDEICARKEKRKGCDEDVCVCGHERKFHNNKKCYFDRQAKRKGNNHVDGKCTCRHFTPAIQKPAGGNNGL